MRSRRRAGSGFSAVLIALAGLERDGYVARPTAPGAGPDHPGGAGATGRGRGGSRYLGSSRGAAENTVALAIAGSDSGGGPESRPI